MKLNERRTRAIKKELRAYVTATADSFKELQEKVEQDHGELVRTKYRLSAVERRLDRRDKKG